MRTPRICMCRQEIAFCISRNLLNMVNGYEDHVYSSELSLFIDNIFQDHIFSILWKKFCSDIACYILQYGVIVRRYFCFSSSIQCATSNFIVFFLEYWSIINLKGIWISPYQCRWIERWVGHYSIRRPCKFFHFTINCALVLDFVLCVYIAPYFYHL